MLGALLAVSLAAAVGSAPALPPVVYQAATRDYDVRLRIAPELKAVPAAYAALQARTEADFTAFQQAAAKDMAKARADSPDSPMARYPEVDRVEVDFVARTPHLIGFVRRDYQDRHGAHGSYVVSGLLFDLRTRERLAATDLLKPGVDMAPLNAALVRRLDAAKRKSGISEGLADGFVKPDAVTWAPRFDMSACHSQCEGAQAVGGAGDKFVVATLVASSTPGKAAGLQFLFSPYDVGSFAEGAYRIVLPQRVFAADLRPEYRDDFGGSPAGDLDRDPLQQFPADVPPVPN